MSPIACPVCGGEWKPASYAGDNVVVPHAMMYCDNCGMVRLEYPGKTPDSAPIVFEAAIPLPRWKN